MLMLVTPIRHLADIVGPITRGIAALERGMELIENTAVQQGGSHTTPKAQVTRGQVLLDGVALPEWDLPNLRQQFAMVSQDVVMLNDTVAANVALGAELDETRVLKALESANLSSWVAGLPQGIHTSVGHNATELSGGQRQRLAIARAVYKDAPILILDEATSALDNESERLVQDALGRLMQGRTTLVIAHRLSTIEHADRVVVLVQGRIVESGTHAQLLAAKGTYSRLHALNTGGSLPA
jgi:subfamily B ATP-binding cassette protein MsbA